MAFRVLTRALTRALTLVMLVLLLALPHPGSRVAVADHAAVPADSMGHGPMHVDASQGPEHRSVACIAICTGSPLGEASGAIAPRGLEFALWAGFDGPLSRALASPGAPSRPPNAPVRA